MRTIIRRASIALAGLFMTLGLGVAGAAAASASPPPPPVTNACPLWANPVLHPTTHPALGVPQYPHCYANETPADLAPYFYL